MVDQGAGIAAQEFPRLTTDGASGVLLAFGWCMFHLPIHNGSGVVERGDPMRLPHLLEDMLETVDLSIALGEAWSRVCPLKRWDIHDRDQSFSSGIEKGEEDHPGGTYFATLPRSISPLKVERGPD